MAKYSDIPNDSVQEDPIQELFENNDLIARSYTIGLKVSDDGYLEYNMDRVKSELKKLKTTRFDGIKYLREDGTEVQRNNVERGGARSKSATLLVPGVKMKLFQGAGFLFNANDTTIRGYMLEDGGTSFQHHQKENFMRIGYEKKRFEQTLSRKEFAEKYKENASKDGSFSTTPYNELLINAYSPIGVVVEYNIDNTGQKLKVLALRHYVASVEGKELPIYLMQNGKLLKYTPDLEEISRLLNNEKPTIRLIKEKGFIPWIKGELLEAKKHTREQLLEKYIENLGYSVKVTDFDKTITPDDITPIPPKTSPIQQVKSPVKSGIVSQENPDIELIDVDEQMPKLTKQSKQDPDQVGQYKLSEELIDVDEQMPKLTKQSKQDPDQVGQYKLSENQPPQSNDEDKYYYSQASLACSLDDCNRSCSCVSSSDVIGTHFFAEDGFFFV